MHLENRSASDITQPQSDEKNSKHELLSHSQKSNPASKHSVVNSELFSENEFSDASLAQLRVGFADASKMHDVTL